MRGTARLIARTAIVSGARPRAECLSARKRALRDGRPRRQVMKLLPERHFAPAKRTVTVGRAKLTPFPGAADANEGGRAGGETFFANRPAACIAYFVYAGIDFPPGRVNRREVLARLRDQGRYVLPLEGDRRALRVMLVIAPGRALARAGDDSAELPLKFGDPAQRLAPIGGQLRLSGTRVSHLRHLSFKMTIRSAGETNAPARQAL